MATVGELVRRAYRQENLIALRQNPSAGQMEEGIERFNSIWRLLIGNKFGEKLLLWPVPPNPSVNEAREWPLLPRNEKLPNDVYPYPQQNSMLVTNLGGPQTVYLKQNPNDGARMGLHNIGASYATNPLTINANGMLIEGQSQLVLNTATTTPLLWFFRADLGDWKRVTTLVEASESPLPEEFDAFFRCALAIDLCPSYGKDPQAITVATYKDGLALGIGRYAQDMPAATEPGNLYAMPFQSFAIYGWGTQV